MKEIEHNGHTYRIGNMSPMDAFHLSRRLAPFLPALAPVLEKITESGEDGDPALKAMQAAGPLADVLAGMSDDEANEIIYRSLKVVMRKTSAGMAPVMNSIGVLGFTDLTPLDMLNLTTRSIRENLGPFLEELRTGGTEALIAA